MNTVFIYSLNCPVSNVVKYIGKTKHALENRLKFHLHDLRGKSHKNHWLLKLKSQGLKPKIELIDEVSVDQWEFWEQYWISQFKTWGFTLTNTSEGGGGNNGVVYSDETKNNMRIAAVRRFNQEQLLGIKRNPFKNKTPDEMIEIKRKQKETRIKNGGYIVSEAGRKQRSEFHTGRKRPESTRKILSEKAKKRGILPETRMKNIVSRSKAVLQVDLNGNVIKEWFSVPFIISELKLKNRSIRNAVVRGTTFNGFKWRYK